MDVCERCPLGRSGECEELRNIRQRPIDEIGRGLCRDTGGIVVLGENGHARAVKAGTIEILALKFALWKKRRKNFVS